MRKILFGFCLLALLSGIQSAHAMSKHQGGYQNTSIPSATIAEVMMMEDDMPVKVEGKITKQVKGDKYQLEDPTGMSIVEIDEEDWGGNMITEQDVVIIYGEVDKDKNGTEIDAKSVKKK